MAGFWELPAPDAIPFPLPGRPRRVGTYRQTFSHFRLTLTVRAALPLPDAPPLPPGVCWCAAPPPPPPPPPPPQILARRRG